MWRDDAQRGAVARALPALVRLEDPWGEVGPTEAAVECLEAGGGPLSSGQAVFLEAYATEQIDAWLAERGAR